MYSAEQSVHAWTSGSASGPLMKPLDADQSRTRLDHWYRIDTLGKYAPQFIRGLLATWPEFNLFVDERPPKMTSTLRRLICATTVHDEHPDISVQCAHVTVGDLSLRKISKVTFAAEILQSLTVVSSLNGLVMFLRIRMPNHCITAR